MTYTIELGWQVEAALNSLSPPDRREVDEALSRLRQGRFGDVPQVYKVHGNPGEQDVSVLRANDRLRLLFTVAEERHNIVIHDLVSRDFVRRYG